MGLTKEYLRYAPAGNFNIITSGNCNIKFVTLEGQEGRFIAVGACEHIIIWDLRLGEKAQVLTGEKAQVTCLCSSPNGRHLAAGYNDGTIQVYDLKSGEVASIFSGHKYEITTLAFDSFGHKLASGSKDTDIIIWDTVSETGVCRLSGHKGAITKVTFLLEYGILVSSSKDELVKFWDLDTQHCFKTLIGHRSEVWSICTAKTDRYLITGCGDGELRAWKLIRDEKEDLSSAFNKIDINEDDPRYPLKCVKAGSLLRAGRGRVVSMTIDVTGQILCCHGTDNQIEIFHFVSDEQANKRRKKRNKQSNETETSLQDEVRRLPAIKLSAKPKSIDVVFGDGGEIRIGVSLTNNIVELYSLTCTKQNDVDVLRTIKTQGHRGEIRALAFSSDNLAIVSGGADGIKLWNRSSQTCLRTCASDNYVVSVCFVPGDRHVLAGLKDGRLLIIDISAGDVLEEIPAHAQNTELWSVVLQPDLRGCVTGGGDKTCKWWNFELIQDESSESRAKVLSLLHVRTLVLEEAVLSVKLTPDNRYVAVALLDSTVKVFFADTFKLHLSLYGHKLPVLCMDVTFDSRIIATGSADRNIKLWGLDFGNCHKSIFAHDDSVTGMQFISRTHLLFSCGKDGSVRQWDADSFARIVTLPSHKGEAWSIAVSPDGRHLVSCGSDRVLRLCHRTEEPLVLEDEREEEREREEEVATIDDRLQNQAICLPTRKTIGSEKAADSILECLEICTEFQDQLDEHASMEAASEKPIALPVPPPLMQAYKATTPEDFILEVLKRIRSSEMEEALLLLPFTSACELLQYLHILAKRGDQTELICKILVFLLKVHHAPFVANQSMLSLLKKIQKEATSKVKELRDLIGYNLHGLQYIQREIENSEGVQLFRDASIDRKSKDKRRKQREKRKRSALILSA